MFDDEAAVRSVARLTLEKVGYTVVEAEDGDKAWSKSESSYTEPTEMITNNARHIQDRVSEIADAVKGVTNEPNFTLCTLHDIVNGVLKSLQISAKEKDVALYAKGLDTLSVIQVDERRLFVALYNLTGNAIPEVPPRGSVNDKWAGSSKNKAP